MKKILRIPLVLSLFFLLLASLPLQAEEVQYEPLPGEGKTCKIGTEYSFVYQFDKKPQLGVVILKIQVSDQNGKQSTSLKITGNSGMPLMPGSHDSGQKEFMLNKKGNYLLPLDLAMPGGWEIKLVFSKNDNVLYRGSINFDI